MDKQTKTDPFLKMLRRIRQRLIAQLGFQTLAWGLLCAAVAATLWVVLTRLFPVLGDPIPVVAGIGGISLLAAATACIVRRPSLQQAALATDQVLGLKERVTSSLSLAGQRGHMVDAVHDDARRHLSGLKIRAAFPFRSPRPLRWAALPLLLLGLASTLLPEMDLLKHRERQAEAHAKQQEVTVQVEKIRSATKAIQAEKAEKPALDGLAEKMNALATGLEKGDLQEREAMAKISNLAREVKHRREALAGERNIPDLNGDLSKLGATKELAKAIQEGRMGDAAKMAEALAKKLQSGNLSPKEMERLQKDMKALSDMLGANSALGEALANASAELNADSLEGALESLGQMQMSLSDLQNTLDQLEGLEGLQFNLAQWQNDMMGEGEYCRTCGLKLGICQSKGLCQGLLHGGYGQGLGLGGAGRGQGNRLGELPDVEVGFDSAKAPGPMTKGKMLADIIQKTAPEKDAEATTQVVENAFIEFRQEAEQALVQEEIPTGSREYVRQYFSSLDPESQE